MLYSLRSGSSRPGATGGNSMRSYRSEIRPMISLAAPLVLAEIGWVTMGIVDTIMVGRLPEGTEAIGATSLGNVVFYVVGVFGSGLLLGLDTLVSQAFGRGDVDDCHHSLLNSLYLVLGIAPPMMAVAWSLLPLLHSIGVHPEVMKLAAPYLWALLWSAPPLMAYFAFRRYLQGMNLVRPVAFALITANLVNVAGNWLLIFGRFGFPRMGVAGSGWSTCIARTYMAGVLLGYILYHEWRHKWGLTRVALRPDVARLRRLFALGFPGAMHICLEVGVFGVGTALAGTLGAVPLAAHQVVLHTSSLTFMVPLGISSAAAVRVGQALGRRDDRGAAQAGWTAVGLGAAFMFCSGLCFVLFPRAISRLYSRDPEVIALGAVLLTLAAVFQLFDGIQGVTVGALRGVGDTRSAMLAHLICDWVIGLPISWYCCYRLGWGVVGLWVGLSLAMILAGISLLTVWTRAVTRNTNP
jgi:multidrug resistance protein, MATE family